MKTRMLMPALLIVVIFSNKQFTYACNNTVAVNSPEISISIQDNGIMGEKRALCEKSKKLAFPQKVANQLFASTKSPAFFGSKDPECSIEPLALVSAGCVVLSVVFMSLYFPLFGILASGMAIVFGAIALKRIRKAGSLRKGKVWAWIGLTGGIALSAVYLYFLIFFLLTMAF